MDADKLFEGMKTAPMFGRGNYMSSGTYEVEIVKAFAKTAFKNQANLFICEFKIVTSSGPVETETKNADGSVTKVTNVRTPHPKHMPGSVGSWAPKIALPNTFGDIKSLMFSILGIDPKTVTADQGEAHNLVTTMARATCGSDTAKAELAALGHLDVNELIAGVRVGLVCEQIKTRANTDFTRYTWSPATADEAAVEAPGGVPL